MPILSTEILLSKSINKSDTQGITELIQNGESCFISVNYAEFYLMKVCMNISKIKFEIKVNIENW